MPVITTAPYTIGASGTYTLGANLDITGVTPDPATGLPIGVKIAPGVGSVTIDCDIYSIRHTGGYGSTGVGIYGAQVANVTIKNANIYGQGMMQGIVIDNAAHPEYMTIAVRDSVVSARLVGIQVRSKLATVENNHVHMTGRQTVDPAGYPGGITINSLGGSAIIRNNKVRQLENPYLDEVFGIACANSYGSVIENNWVENNTKLTDSWAFWLSRYGTYTVANNFIKNFDYGFGLVVDTSGTISGTTFDNVDHDYTPSSMPDLSTWTIT